MTGRATGLRRGAAPMSWALMPLALLSLAMPLRAQPPAPVRLAAARRAQGRDRRAFSPRAATHNLIRFRTGAASGFSSARATRRAVRYPPSSRENTKSPMKNGAPRIAANNGMDKSETLPIAAHRACPVSWRYRNIPMRFCSRRDGSRSTRKPGCRPARYGRTDEPIRMIPIRVSTETASAIGKAARWSPRPSRSTTRCRCRPGMTHSDKLSITERIHLSPTEFELALSMR